MARSHDVPQNKFFFCRQGMSKFRPLVEDQRCVKVSCHSGRSISIRQELRVDEFSAKKLRASHETTQRLISQLQSMQEQMNSMSDSGEFQEVESHYSGRLAYVPSQPTVIPSSRSMLSRDKRLPFDTWNTSGLQENFFGNQFLHLIRPKIIIKEFTIVRHQ